MSTESSTNDGDAQRRALMTALTTEQITLQSASDATVADAGARSSLYVFALSSSLVAMGFISQSPDVFVPFVSAVLPAVFLLGVLTVIRLVDSALENMQYLSGIARIRGNYRTLLPDGEIYFAASTGRWPEGPDPVLGLGPFVAFLSTTASMIALINAVVGGAGVALLVNMIVGGRPDWLGPACGVVAFVILMVAFYVFQRWRFSQTMAVTARASDSGRR